HRRVRLDLELVRTFAHPTRLDDRVPFLGGERVHVLALQGGYGTRIEALLQTTLDGCPGGALLRRSRSRERGRHVRLHRRLEERILRTPGQTDRAVSSDQHVRRPAPAVEPARYRLAVRAGVPYQHRVSA